MTMKLFNLNKWTRLAAGQQLDLPGERPRKVVLEVNAGGEARLDYVDPNGEVQFLAMVYGRETLEFIVSGKFSVITDTDDTFIYTADGISVHHVVEAPESFVRIMEKRARNPELERIAFQMNQNMHRRLEQQSDELNAMFERRFAAREALIARSRAPVSVGAEPAPKPDADDGSAGGADDGNTAAPKGAGGKKQPAA